MRNGGFREVDLASRRIVEEDGKGHGGPETTRLRVMIREDTGGRINDLGTVGIKGREEEKE